MTRTDQASKINIIFIIVTVSTATVPAEHNIVRLLSFSKLTYIADLHKEEIIIEFSLVNCLTLFPVKN